ncbi:MAG: tyrosine-type recombinase/integrase [Hydrotalea flava]|uniref:site-specific integrase n=1 Tax=Hydrotalea TaxID=1004300 RepID=UPI00094392F8|nr:MULTISPECIES: site-specific integrase [Hydrotalea]NIM34728.1 tyrosine-type recombinase/integrase [Hydrotalea flava]NIM37564.1 tyrosine-type recombinase/integrase [Hydrotalea flava]NIN02724.1 tyrosine-type recombinase/integrase [Hydrotalea flava]NIN14409.1 tyrosine-type recombinase/integrase [Hydrotalea flava]NIO93490.1 tyrosine-type recombinase/integrase [Hydrotalea flava]
MAIKVKLREKKISGNRQSLYLDFYPAIPHPETGEPTRREFLGLYLFDKAKNPIDKQGNKETLQLAEQIRQKRENHLNKPEIYTGYELEQKRIKERGEQNFVAYFKSLADKRKASNHDNWVSAYSYLETFTKGNLKFVDLNEKFCNEFKEYLLTTKSNKSSKTTLAQNSAVSYFNKLKATLKQAYKDGYLTTDLNAKIEPIKQAETRRNFLTIEELNSLVKTECNNPLLKCAALFSALTGLRFSDIQKLVWGEIYHSVENGYSIQFTQQKTKGVEVLPISKQAYSLLGEPKEPTRKVFEGLTYSAYENKHLYQWIGAAGITKDITFHCFRHTFATLQLSKGTDIYTVSKMLGHRELKTTQIYAKIIDQTKREAADKIKLDF